MTIERQIFQHLTHEELREGHPELMNSREDLMDIQSEDECYRRNRIFGLYYIFYKDYLILGLYQRLLIQLL